MEKLVRDKHSSLLRKFVNYGRKNTTFGPGVSSIKLFTAVIVAVLFLTLTFAVSLVKYLRARLGEPIIRVESFTSLFGPFVRYYEKKFDTIGSRARNLQTFAAVINYVP